MSLLTSFRKFIGVSNPPPGNAYFWRTIRATNGDRLTLQRLVPLSGGAMRAYYFSPRSGIRAVDRQDRKSVV